MSEHAWVTWALQAVLMALGGVLWKLLAEVRDDMKAHAERVANKIESVRSDFAKHELTSARVAVEVTEHARRLAKLESH